MLAKQSTPELHPQSTLLSINIFLSQITRTLWPHNCSELSHVLHDAIHTERVEKSAYTAFQNSVLGLVAVVWS
jgi:hypothetical protein